MTVVRSIRSAAAVVLVACCISAEGTAVAAEDARAATAPLAGATDAFVAHDYEKARSLAKGAGDAPSPAAARIDGASACMQRKHDDAVVAWQSTDREGQALIRYVCARHAIRVP